MAVWTPFRDGVVGGNITAEVTTGEVAETKEAYRWLNTGHLRPPMPLGSGSSDVANFEEWLASTPEGSTIEFPPGVTYLQASPVRYLPNRRYLWPGVDSPTTQWRVIDGTNMGAVSGMWVPKVWDDNNDDGQLPVEFVHPCLNGNRSLTSGGHHGLILGGSHWWRVHRPYIASCLGDGLRLTNLAKNGTTVLGSDPGTPNDMADGGIYDVRIVNNAGCGIRQALAAGTNGHMDVILSKGRVWDCGQSGILLDRGSGWEIDGIKLFVIGHHAIRSLDSWFVLNIHDCVVEDFGGVADAGTYYGIAATGFVGHGCNIHHNQVRQNSTFPEPGTGTHVYLNVDYSGAAGTIGQANVSNNVIRGPDSPRAGNYGMWFQGAGGGVLYVTGMNTNLVTNVANRRNVTGIVHDPAHLHVRKPANEAVTSSTALQNDDHLVLPVEVGTSYEVEAFLIYDGAATTGDIQVAFTVPAGATLDWTPGGLATDAGALSGSVKLAHVTTGAEGLGAVGTGAGNRAVARISGRLQVGSTAGTLQLQWAQLASSATPTTVLAGSTLTARRVP